MEREYTSKRVTRSSTWRQIACILTLVKKAIIKSQCTRTAELTSRTPENENSSLSSLYLEVDKALKEAGLLEGKTKLPKLSMVMDARERYKDSSREKGKEEKG